MVALIGSSIGVSFGALIGHMDYNAGREFHVDGGDAGAVYGVIIGAVIGLIVGVGVRKIGPVISRWREIRDL